MVFILNLWLVFILEFVGLCLYLVIFGGFVLFIGIWYLRWKILFVRLLWKLVELLRRFMLNGVCLVCIRCFVCLEFFFRLLELFSRFGVLF